MKTSIFLVVCTTVLSQVASAVPYAAEIHPDGTNDCTCAVVAAIDNARSAGGGRIAFAPGEYHFRSPVSMRFYVSNHDNPMPRNVFLPVTNLTDVTFAGDRAEFVFHGEGIAIALIDDRRVKMCGIGVDYSRPYMSETRILRLEDGRPVFRADPVQFPMEVRDGLLYSVGEGWSMLQNLAEDFAGDTLAFRCAFGFGKPVTALGGNTFRIDRDCSGTGLAKGDVLHIRSTWRPNPAIFLCRAHDSVLEDCPVHASAGMGMIAQRCRNVTVRGSGRAADRTAGSFARAGTGRAKSLQADATHFSNCSGLVTVENCLFDGMVDDAINVHSTCLRIESTPSLRTIRCRYTHKQSIGFETFLPGERLRGIHARTFEEAETTVAVADVRTLAPDVVELHLAAPLPEGLAAGDAVENADWQPSVIFRNNIVRNSKPRATLFTTPGRVVCESNIFDHVAAQAVHMSGDAFDWYESGGCRDVVIRGNVFRRCLESSSGNRGIVTINPNVNDIAAQKRRYHRNIVIEDNVMECGDVPLLWAHSVSNLVWRNNRVTRPADAKSEAFHVVHSDEVAIDR